jgi:hypothetical protein
LATLLEDIVRYALKLLLLIVCTQLPLFAAAMNSRGDQSAGRTTHGTVNVFLGNEKGLVVVTDSRLSSSVGFRDAGQKLFKIDDHTVCTIAGWYSDVGPEVGPVGDTPSFPAEMSIPVFINNFLVSARSVNSLEQKMFILSAVFRSTLRAVAAVDAHAGIQPNFSPSQLTLAGLSEDGIIEILQRDFVPSALNGMIMGYDEVDHPPILLTPDTKLVAVIRGIPDTANSILSGTHRLTSTDPILQYLTESLHKDGGKSLSLQDMEQIAKRMERVTALDHPREVGGPQQIAEITSGLVSNFVQPISAPTVLPKMIAMELNQPHATGVGVAFYVAFPLITIVNGGQVVDSGVRLDNVFTFNSTFMHCHLMYGGSQTTIFDKSNTLVESTLSLERASDLNSPFVRQLRSDFPDLRIESSAPGNPPVLSSNN